MAACPEKRSILHSGVLCPHLDRKINPGNGRHRDVRYEHIRSFQPGGGQGLQWTGEEPGGEPVHLQYGGESGCDDRFIVNNENACGRHIYPLSSSFSVNSKSASIPKLAFRVISQPQSTGEELFESYVPRAGPRAGQFCSPRGLFRGADWNQAVCQLKG